MLEFLYKEFRAKATANIFPLHRHLRRTEQASVELSLPMFHRHLHIPEWASVELSPPTLHRQEHHPDRRERASVELSSPMQDLRVGRPSGRDMENQGNYASQ